MVTKSDNTIGNPYHSDENGQFTSPNESNSSKSISFVPKITSFGKKRTFFSDLTNSEKQDLFDAYNSKHGSEAEAISKLKINYDTSRDKSNEREMKRNMWINDEFNSQHSETKRKDRKATILLGLPGSGKSTIAVPLMNKQGMFVVDADNFKKRISEFRQDPMMVSAVHQESVDLSNRFRKELAKDGWNMVIGKVGGDYESVSGILDDLEKNGYEVDVILNDVPLDVALDRTIGRYERKETSRLVPLSTLINADKNVFNTFDKVLEHPIVKKGSIYSNDVPKGTLPKLLHSFKKGE